ncbi:MAG: amidohydrolase family protein, partial [Planctomycetes bacterium]|nr:amidohydrolase family protein [Planctomycetota bacterium]
VELEAIRRAIFFSRETGARLHIVHMSIHEGAEELKRAKAEGVPVTFETCPHYLVSDCSLLERRGPFGKCTPPLRRPENTEAMWRYIEDETIDFIASDSSCYAKEEKMLGIDDIWLAEPGLPGSATMVPMMADAFIHKRKLPMDLFARLLSANVAKVFGLYPQKGTILPGGDADFTILDPRRSWVVDGSKLYKCGWSTYDGEEVGVSVDSTIVRGEIVCQNGEFQLGKGYGRFVRPLR